MRMLIIFALSGAFVSKGLTYACSAAVLGICAGEIISFFYVLASYVQFKKKNRLNKKPSMGRLKTAHAILKSAIPLSANRITGSVLATIENIMIPQMLILYGLSNSKAMEAYGELTGMAMPLIQFPAAFLVALSITLVPAVSEAATIKNLKQISFTISKSMLFTAVIGIGASCLFVVFPEETGYLIYKNTEVGNLLFKLGFMCPFFYLQIVLSGLLNGLGEQAFIFRNSILSSFIVILFVYFLIPVYGIDAFITGMFISMLVISSLSLKKITSKTKIVFDYKNWIIKPVGAAFFSGCIAYFLKRLFPSVSKSPVLFLSIVCVMYLSYFLYLVITKCILTEDIHIITKNFKKPEIFRSIFN